MDDFAAGADLCEENQLLDQARLLRVLAGPGGRLYLVAERGAEYNDNWYDVASGDGEFRTVFADRDEAQRAVDRANARKFREINLRDFGNSGDMSTLDEDELYSRVGQILGQPFSLRRSDRYDHLFPFAATLTDDQMIAIARLFDKMQFFHVIEAEFGG